MAQRGHATLQARTDDHTHKAEIQLIIDDSTAPMFERQLADATMHADWNILERTINQVYGPPVQRIEQTNIPAPIN